MSAERWLTPTDQRLLRTLIEVPNLARAARRVGIGRDRAVYRIRRLARLYGGPVVSTRRGGPAIGGSHLTPLGRRLLGADPTARRAGSAHRWTGIYRTTPGRRIELGGGAALEVAFSGKDGEPVTVDFDPESFLIARGRFDSSARNVLRGRVTRIVRRRDGRATVFARWAGRSVHAAVTARSVDQLGLRPGSAVYLYLKAVAVRRVR
ncbi:MAG: TOBE domain-containing protein [Thermoplasmata archaeon]